MTIQKARNMQRRMNRRISAGEEIVEETPVVVAPEATDLLFEAEDVAELIAEVTGEAVEVDVADDAVTFTVADEEYVVEPDGDEELLEACSRKSLRGKRNVKASRAARPVGRRRAIRR